MTAAHFGIAHHLHGFLARSALAAAGSSAALACAPETHPSGDGSASNGAAKTPSVDASSVDAADCVAPDVCVNDKIEQWSDVCLYSSTPVPSASLNRVCLVRVDGVIGWTRVRGDMRVSDPSIRHSGWGGGYYASTLTQQETDACQELLDSAPTSACWRVPGTH
jgi:hypothetical protein